MTYLVVGFGLLFGGRGVGLGWHPVRLDGQFSPLAGVRIGEAARPGPVVSLISDQQPLVEQPNAPDA